MLCCPVLDKELDPTYVRSKAPTQFTGCIADHKKHNLSHHSGFSQTLATPAMDYLAEWSLNYIAVPSGSHAIPWLFVILKQDSWPMILLASRSTAHIG